MVWLICLSERNVGVLCLNI